MDTRKRQHALAGDGEPSDGFQTPQKKVSSSASIPQDADFMGWGVDDVRDYLYRQGLQPESEQWESKFREERINGVALRNLSEERLEKMSIPLSVRLYIHQCLRKLTAEPNKVFNDPIHGHIELHPVLIRIIDTPQFQRLRNIKQLGGAYMVFPGASHNRFEHSIGVGHLAGMLVQALHERQPELLISLRDILCVQIAGLCHDLGHGPFSHMFDRKFIPEARPGCNWKHETASLDMFDYLVSDNRLKSVMERHGLLPDDLIFIREQIAGHPLDTSASLSQGAPNENLDPWLYKGRPKEKSFLYEIVANKRNGIDVDKWDYFARDCYHLGIQNTFDYRRFLKFARVCEWEGEKQICTRYKEVFNLYNLFHTRNCLHRGAYQHPVGNIIETMITEALIKADPHIQIIGSGKRTFKLSTAIDDMEAYTKLTDHVFERILYSSNPKLAEASEILSNIVRRCLYKCVGQTQKEKPEKPEKPEEPIKVTKELCKQWAKEIAIVKPKQPSDSGHEDVELQPEDLEIHVINFNYGMKEKDPISKMRFYSKVDPTKAIEIRKDQVSKMLPEHFAEQIIRVYYKKIDDEQSPEATKKHEQCLEAARKHFVQWCIINNFCKPQDGDVTAPELTPLKKSWANRESGQGKAKTNLASKFK